MPVPSPAEMQRALEMHRNQKAQQDAASAPVMASAEALSENRRLAFAKAVINAGMVDNTALEFHEGDVEAAAKALGLDLDA